MTIPNAFIIADRHRIIANRVLLLDIELAVGCFRQWVNPVHRVTIIQNQNGRSPSQRSFSLFPKPTRNPGPVRHMRV
jgi:hypothetical protein